MSAFATNGLDPRTAAQALRDKADHFSDLHVSVLGASFDTVAENLDFAEAQRLPFQLLSDADRRVGASYGVVRSADDKFAGFARRYSFLIDPAGVIHRTYDVTDVAGHAGDIIADVEAATRQT